jgi:hypothetical protein
MSSNQRPKLLGAGLQNANRQNNSKKQGNLQRRGTALPGKTLSFRATAQVFYKYNSEDGDEEALSPQVSFERCVANSKASTASFAEEITLTVPSEHRHHISIVVRMNEDKHGRVFEVQLHAHKYVKNNDDGSMTFRESVKYKTDENDRNKNLSDRWYTGIVGFKVQASGSINPNKPPKPQSSTQVVPIGDPDVPPGPPPLMFKLLLKSVMQAPPSASNDPEHKKREQKRASAQRRQVCLALFIILLFLGSGAVFYPLVEGWRVLDSIYWGMVTITTVGCKCLYILIQICFYLFFYLFIILILFITI